MSGVAQIHFCDLKLHNILVCFSCYENLFVIFFEVLLLFLRSCLRECCIV
jgi:hypothetical protein